MNIPKIFSKGEKEKRDQKKLETTSSEKNLTNIIDRIDSGHFSHKVINWFHFDVIVRVHLL